MHTADILRKLAFPLETVPHVNVHFELLDPSVQACVPDVDSI